MGGFNETLVPDETESQPLVELKEQYGSNHIEAMHGIVEKRFSTYYESCGYTKHSEAPLISKADRSVIFTGASISAVKYLIEEDRIPDPGIYIIQPCIRTQDSRDAYDDSVVPLGQTFFNMATILAPTGRYPEVCREALEFTTESLGIDPHKIKIKVTSKDPLLAEYWGRKSDTDVSIEYDTHPDKYYKWKYGMPGISGSGLTVSVHNQATDSYWDVGNIVILREDSGKEVGTEFGYGIEFLLSGALGVDEPLRMSKISEIEPYQGGLHQKYTAYLEALIQMSAAGASIGDKGADHLFKQYIKVINHLRKGLSLENDDVLDTCRRYCDKFGLEESFPQLEENLEFMRVHEDRIQGFMRYVETISSTKQLVTDPLKKLTDRAQQLGLAPEETVEILKATSYKI
jgi:hypothetical protein